MLLIISISQRAGNCLGSPDCNIDRTFTSTFYFPYKATKTKKITLKYRNPIYLAREYKQMIDNDQVKNQSDLARNSISREQELYKFKDY